MNPIKRLINSFKRDIEIILTLCTEPQTLKFDFSRIFKPQYFFLLLVLCFLCGAYVSAKYYESKVNDAIMTACGNDIVNSLMLNNDPNNYTFHAKDFGFAKDKQESSKRLKEIDKEISNESN